MKKSLRMDNIFLNLEENKVSGEKLEQVIMPHFRKLLEYKGLAKSAELLYVKLHFKYPDSGSNSHSGYCVKYYGKEMKFLFERVILIEELENL